MMAGSKRSWRNAAFARGSSEPWQYAAAVSRIMRSSSVNCASS
jgi:hypothetical protein